MTMDAKRYPYQVAAAIVLALQERLLISANNAVGRADARPHSFGRGGENLPVLTLQQILVSLRSSTVC
jgi:hypothetical protein